MQVTGTNTGLIEANTGRGVDIDPATVGPAYDGARLDFRWLDMPTTNPDTAIAWEPLPQAHTTGPDDHSDWAVIDDDTTHPAWDDTYARNPAGSENGDIKPGPAGPGVADGAGGPAGPPKLHRPETALPSAPK